MLYLIWHHTRTAGFDATQYQGTQLSHTLRRQLINNKCIIKGWHCEGFGWDLHGSALCSESRVSDVSFLRGVIAAADPTEVCMISQAIYCHPCRTSNVLEMTA